ncbi:hypothetical protein MTR67_050932 [Solanum verrucosum]|uniref:Uncharacterized protein n=1 Tax=Solanum verrucosum TaxID=315347 RepID=A0AAF0V3C2_SOLVR|nr:hypothetical protein MTR67_050932 [Solanum verrucosum]
MLPHAFDELGQYWNIDKFKAISDQAKKARGSLKGGSLHTGGAKTVGTISREMTTPVKLRRYWIVTSSRALDGVQIAVMSDQIAKLTAVLAESEQRRVAEQESMSETVQQTKEQVMNLTHRRTTSAPDDTDDESDEDDYVDPTP